MPEIITAADASRNRSAVANLRHRPAVQENGRGNAKGIVTVIVTAEEIVTAIVAETEIVTAIVAETETVTAIAAETVTHTEIRVLAITTPVLSPVLIPDRLTIPAADATVSNHYAVALSFWLTEGKGNDKLNSGTSQKASADPYVRTNGGFGMEDKDDRRK